MKNRFLWIAILLALFQWSWADQLVKVKVAYDGGKVIEKADLTDQQSLDLMLDLVKSEQDGVFELWAPDKSHVKFVVKGEKIEVINRGKTARTMTRKEFLQANKKSRAAPEGRDPSWLTSQSVQDFSQILGALESHFRSHWLSFLEKN